jgi:Mn2+/Fe2+ NRAMP family transporter
MEYLALKRLNGCYVQGIANVTIFGAAIINGVVAVPVMIVTTLLSTSTNVMRQFRIPWILRIVGCAATLMMLLASIGLFATLKQ